MGISPTQPTQSAPDFAALVRFLLEPFLESPQSLKVDCETSQGRSKAWVRVAFDGEDKGRVFGRGGRNIQAIRTVLQAVASLSGYSAYLDIYGGQGDLRETKPTGGSTKPKARSRSQAPRSRSGDA